MGGSTKKHLDQFKKTVDDTIGLDSQFQANMDEGFGSATETLNEGLDSFSSTVNTNMGTLHDTIDTNMQWLTGTSKDNKKPINTSSENYSNAAEKRKKSGSGGNKDPLLAEEKVKRNQGKRALYATKKQS